MCHDSSEMDVYSSSLNRWYYLLSRFSFYSASLLCDPVFNVCFVIISRGSMAVAVAFIYFSNHERPCTCTSYTLYLSCSQWRLMAEQQAHNAVVPSLERIQWNYRIGHAACENKANYQAFYGIKSPWYQAI